MTQEQLAFACHFHSASWRDFSALPSGVTKTLPAFFSERIDAAQPLHICFVAPHFWPVFSGDPDIPVAGGAEVQQSRLARLLARNGYQVSVVCQDYGQPPLVVQDGIRIIHSFAERDGIPVVRFVHPRLTSIWRALHKVDADIYYQRSAGMSLAVVTAFCRRNGKKSIFAGASDADFVPGGQLIHYRRDRWLFERGLAQADAIVVQNKKQKHLCAEHYGRDSTLIPSIYELPVATEPGRGDTVLWVGAMRRPKRPELFLDMAKQLPQRRFVMIGGPAGDTTADHHYFSELQQSAEQLPNVEFAGFMPLAKVEPYFDHARVLINTSTVEGMPNTFLQAWARGVPTVAFSDIGSRLHGIPVTPVVADAAEGAATIERMFADQTYHARASGRCLEYFKNTHGSDTVLEKYRDLLHNLADS
jgi:glycosyltransferase involved in cell wall biosynthesis